jgi:hypothetical protein
MGLDDGAVVARADEDMVEARAQVRRSVGDSLE